jgi:hypothetical protein
MGLAERSLSGLRAAPSWRTAGLSDLLDEAAFFVTVHRFLREKLSHSGDRGIAAASAARLSVSGLH